MAITIAIDSGLGSTCLTKKCLEELSLDANLGNFLGVVRALKQYIMIPTMRNSTLGKVQSHIECQTRLILTQHQLPFVLLQVLTSTELRRELTDWVTKKFL